MPGDKANQQTEYRERKFKGDCLRLYLLPITQQQAMSLRVQPGVIASEAKQSQVRGGGTLSTPDRFHRRLLSTI